MLTVNDELKLWLRDNAVDVVPVLRFLQANPAELSLLLTAAALESGAERTFYEGAGGARECLRVRDWLDSALFAPCSWCFAPCVCFQSGHKLSWPEMEWHECSGLMQPDTDELVPAPVPALRPNSRVAPL